MRVAFFTAGTKGAGHAVRGLAVKRALDRAGIRADVRLFGPAAAPWSPGFETVPVVEDELRDPRRAKESSVARALEAFAPDVLLVDMFWAPLRHVLPLRDCEAWLLLRSFPPKWLVGPPGHPFEASQYARRIAIEPIAAAHDAITDVIDPVVILDPSEQRPRGALRARMGVAPDKRLVVVAHAGNPGEIGSLVPALGRDDALVTFDLHSGGAPFPVAEWLADADAVHAAAGYNTFWEATWLGHAPRTRFTAFARPNDDQRARLEAPRHAMKGNGADMLAAMLKGPSR